MEMLPLTLLMLKHKEANLPMASEKSMMDISRKESMSLEERGGSSSKSILVKLGIFFKLSLMILPIFSRMATTILLLTMNSSDPFNKMISRYLIYISLAVLKLFD